MAAQHALFAQQPIVHCIFAQAPLDISTGQVTGKTCVEKNRLITSAGMRETLANITISNPGLGSRFFAFVNSKRFVTARIGGNQPPWREP